MTPQEKFQQLLASKRLDRDNVAAKLNNLETELHTLELAYRRTFGEADVETPKTMRGGVSARIFQALAAAPAEGMSANELQMATRLNHGTIKQSLAKWAKDGKVVRLTKGRYKPKGADDGTDGNDGRKRGHEADLES